MSVFKDIVADTVLDHLNNTPVGQVAAEPDVDFDRETVTVRLTFAEVMQVPLIDGVITDPRLLAMLDDG